MRVQTTALTVVMIIGMGAGVGACDSGEGGGQKAKGRIESAVGSVTGDAKLKREGKKDEVVGGLKNTVGDLKATVQDAGK